MATVQKITWQDKQGLNEYEIRINQVQDRDMNEVKDAMNTNADILEGLVGGYQGELLIADTPTEDGYYMAGESGTYVNAGNVVVDLTQGITFINVSETQTVFTTTVIPIETYPPNTGEFDPTDNVTPATQKSTADWSKDYNGKTDVLTNYVVNPNLDETSTLDNNWRAGSTLAYEIFDISNPPRIFTEKNLLRGFKIADGDNVDYVRRVDTSLINPTNYSYFKWSVYLFIEAGDYPPLGSDCRMFITHDGGSFISTNNTLTKLETGVYKLSGYAYLDFSNVISAFELELSWETTYIRPSGDVYVSGYSLQFADNENFIVDENLVVATINEINSDNDTLPVTGQAVYKYPYKLIDLPSVVDNGNLNSEGDEPNWWAGSTLGGEIFTIPNPPIYFIENNFNRGYKIAFGDNLDFLRSVSLLWTDYPNGQQYVRFSFYLYVESGDYPPDNNRTAWYDNVSTFTTNYDVSITKIEDGVYRYSGIQQIPFADALTIVSFDMIMEWVSTIRPSGDVYICGFSFCFSDSPYIDVVENFKNEGGSANYGIPSNDVYIAVATDLHINNAKQWHWTNWMDIVSMFNGVNPNLMLCMGDALETILDQDEMNGFNIGFEMLDFPKYICVGNHDVPNNPTSTDIDTFYATVKDNYYNNNFPAFSGTKTGYYKFYSNGINIIVLNSSFVSDDTSNGQWSLGATQETWFQNELDLLTTDDDLIVIVHADPARTDLDTYYRIDEDEQLRIQGYLTNCDARVLVVLNGHIHQSQLNLIGGVNYVSINSNAQLEAKDRQNLAGAVIRINQLEGTVDINGIGKQVNYSFSV